MSGAPVRLYDDIHEGLRALSFLTGRSIASLVNEAVGEYLDRKAGDESLEETVMRGLTEQRRALKTIKAWAAQRSGV